MGHYGKSSRLVGVLFPKGHSVAGEQQCCPSVVGGYFAKAFRAIRDGQLCDAAD